MRKSREHRRYLSSIPKLRVLDLGERLNNTCGNLAHDRCTDSWMTLLFTLQDAWSEVRNFCPEIPLDEDSTQRFDEKLGN